MAFLTALLLVVFLVVVQLVTASGDGDRCDSHSVSCNPTAFGARPVILISSIISVIVLIPVFMRVWRLKRTTRSEDDTLFWWYLCFCAGGSFVWVFYFWDCSSGSMSMFPVLATSLVLTVVYLILVFWATAATCGVNDWRLLLMFAIPLGLWIVGYGLRWHVSVNAAGWWGCALICMSHSFRVASINYRINPDGDVKQCGLGVRTISGAFSAIGAIGGGLWLINPQLCFSLEYKVTSYAIALLRSWETIQWISRPLARRLSRIEGQMDE